MFTLMQNIGLKTATALFPLFLPIWEERPFEYVDFELGPRPIKMTAAELDWQVEQGFTYADEPTMRSLMVRELGQTEDAYAAKLLLARLETEADFKVKATILRQLPNLPRTQAGAARIVEPYIEAEHPGLRQAAAYCYAGYPQTSAERLLKVLDKHKDPESIRAVLAALLVHRKAPGFARLKRFRSHDKQVVARLAWSLSCHSPDAEKYGAAFTGEAENGALITRFAIAEELAALPPETARPIARLLQSDPIAPCRAATAASLNQMEGSYIAALLVNMTADDDYSVREAAIAALASHPDTSGAQAVVTALADPSRVVREAAEKSAARIYQTRPEIAELAASQLKAEQPEVRRHTFRALGAMGATEQADNIRQALAVESVPENLAAGLNTVFALEMVSAEEKIIELVAHARLEVRKAAVRATGILNTEKVHQLLVDAVRDESDAVSYEAIVAMGRTHDPEIAELLLKILKSVEADSAFSARHRAAACWTAARIPTVPKPLLARLRTQATQAVIPTPAGMAYDDSLVISSAAMAIADIARRQPAARPFAEAVLQKLKHEEDTAAVVASSYVPTPLVQEIARQAEDWMKGRRITPGARTTRSIPLSYKKINTP